MRVLVTGSTGFIGAVVCRRLVEAGASVAAAVRGPVPAATDGIDWIRIGAIDTATDWSAALDGAGVVVHLAARTHTRSASQDGAFRTLNVDGTRALAEQAVRAGVRRFVYLSSIKVNGERSPCDGAQRPLRLSGRDAPHPEDAYGRTKWEAERLLHAIVVRRGAGLVILRPPLVYGPGQKGNLRRLMRWVALGAPLPFASVSNLRSLIYVENLADAVVCAVLEATASGTYTLADVDVSTPDLIRAMAAALGRPARLFAVPVRLLRAASAITGSRSMIERLTGSLVVDSDEIRTALGWRPAVGFGPAMAATAAWFHGLEAAR